MVIRPPHLQHNYTKSNQTTTQPSLEAAHNAAAPPPGCGCCLSPVSAHRSSHPSITIHCINSRQYKVDATSNRPTVRSLPFVGCGCCLTLQNQCPGYSTSSYKLQRTVSASTTTWTTWIDNDLITAVQKAYPDAIVEAFQHDGTTKLVESMSQSHVQFGEGEASLCLIQNR
jgi:hypothetical protein